MDIVEIWLQLFLSELLKQWVLEEFDAGRYINENRDKNLD